MKHACALRRGEEEWLDEEGLEAYPRIRLSEPAALPTATGAVRMFGCRQRAQ
jgi:hypothetical protein